MKTTIKLTIPEYHNHLCHINIIKNKNYYYCTKCNYKTNRKYHARMHFIRIHINNGNPLVNKRKHI